MNKQNNPARAILIVNIAIINNKGLLDEIPNNL
jgi:hypothetical protein